MSTRVESTNFYDYSYPNLGNKLYDLLKNNNILVLLNRINLLYLESNENSTLLSKFAINDALFIERLDYNNFILNIITDNDNFRKYSQ